MRSGFNASRRNRNIGTAKQGHGQDNRLRVPSPRNVGGPFWEQIRNYKLVRRRCGDREFPIFVEETLADCLHACTVGDVVEILNLIPVEHYRKLAAIVLRQPKRKEEVLQPVWGRMAYWSNVGRPQEGSVAGPVVFLDAGDPFRSWVRGKPGGPADAAELERLAADGHVISSFGSRLRIQSSLESRRATQLYRTLPHEIGHLVDWVTKVPEEDETKGISFTRHWELDDAFWSRPSQEREAFAHRYADEFRARLATSGRIPFSRIESWSEDGLRSSDFVFS